MPVKKFENRLIFGEEMDKNLRLTFFGPPCISSTILRQDSNVIKLYSSTAVAKSHMTTTTIETGAFLAAAIWGGQRGGYICIWGPRIPDDIIHD